MTRFARFGLTTITVAPLLFLASSAVAQQMSELDYRPLAASIPVNSPWALALIALLIMTVGFLALRRSGVRTDRFMTIALPVLSGALVAAALTGPQVTQALPLPPSPPIVTDLELAGGGTVDIGLGENRFENTSGVTQVIIAIRNLPPCYLGNETRAELSTLGMEDPLPQCVVRGDAEPPFSVDTLAPDESCAINTGEIENGIVPEGFQALNGSLALCRLPFFIL